MLLLLRWRLRWCMIPLLLLGWCTIARQALLLLGRCTVAWQALLLLGRCTIAWRRCTVAWSSVALHVWLKQSGEQRGMLLSLLPVDSVQLLGQGTPK